MSDPRPLGLAALPLDLLVDHLLPALPNPSLLNLGATSSSFQSVTSLDILWRRKLSSDFRFPLLSTARATGFKVLYSRLARPHLYTWGQNRNGRLGLGPAELEGAARVGDGVGSPVRVREPKACWVDLKASGWGFHALDKEGRVWAWGTLNGENWASPDQGFECTGKVANTPMRLSAEGGLPSFKALAAGRSHALALSDSRQIYQWHAWACPLLLSPASLPFLGADIVQIVAGWNISGVLCAEGEVWVWGDLSHLGSEKKDEVDEVDAREQLLKCPPLPKDDAFADDKIVKLAAGIEFLICLTERARVFRLDLSPVPGLMPVDTEDQERSTREQAALHTAFLDGRRGWESLPKFWNPEEIARLPQFEEPAASAGSSASPSASGGRPVVRPPQAGVKMTHVSAMYTSFAAFSVTEESAASFVLLGHKDRPTEPEVVPELQGRGVIDVCHGDYHQGALLSNGQLLTWGKSSSGALGFAPPPAPAAAPGGPGGGGPHALPSVLLRGGMALRRGLAFARQHPAPPDVNVPTPVPAFSGNAGAAGGARGDRGREGAVGGEERSAEREEREEREGGLFVFAASFAGWHSGCLAVPVDPSPVAEQESSIEA